MTSLWLSRSKEDRYAVMYAFRILLTRECFARFLRKRRHQRRLWRVAKVLAETRDWLKCDACGKVAYLGPSEFCDGEVDGVRCNRLSQRMEWASSDEIAAAKQP